MRCYYILLRLAEAKKMTIQIFDVEQKKLTFIAGSNEKWYSHFGRQFDSFIQS